MTSSRANPQLASFATSASRKRSRGLARSDQEARASPPNATLTKRSTWRFPFGNARRFCLGPNLLGGRNRTITALGWLRSARQSACLPPSLRPNLAEYLPVLAGPPWFRNLLACRCRDFGSLSVPPRASRPSAIAGNQDYPFIAYAPSSRNRPDLITSLDRAHRPHREPFHGLRWPRTGGLQRVPFFTPLGPPSCSAAYSVSYSSGER